MTVYDLQHGNIVLQEKIAAHQIMKVKVTLQKGIYTVCFDKKTQKVKIGR